jgi:hypothetical protein
MIMTMVSTPFFVRRQDVSPDGGEREEKAEGEAPGLY